MPAPNGSDSERLMAEIEAFLRTGEGPPAAPEPPASATLPATRPYQPGRPDEGSGGRAGPGRGRKRGGRGRRGVWSRVGSGVRFGAGSRVWSRVAGWAWWSRVSRVPGRVPGAARHPGVSPELPQWSPARVVLVAAVIAGLALIPVVWPQHKGASSPAAADHASNAPAGPGYSFASLNPTRTPVRWNPCSTIEYQVDLTGAPPGALRDVATATATISQATGIAFDYQGTTNQLPTGNIPAGAGVAESPVVIAWADAQQSRSADLPVDLPRGSSTAGSSPSADNLAKTVLIASVDQSTGHQVYVSGSVVMSAAAAHLPAGFVQGGQGVLLLHELGRLMGLASVAASGQIMNPSVLSTHVTGLGAGDRAGLRRLGRSSGCLAVPADGSLQTIS